jgi:hypothetical protein
MTVRSILSSEAGVKSKSPLDLPQHTEQGMAPPRMAARWVRYMVGFSAGVASGLAVYLGQFRIPLFAPLLDLIPQSMRDTIIPFSSTLMGIVAVTIQYLGESKRGVRPYLFIVTLVVTIGSLIFAMLVNADHVVSVDSYGDNHVTFLICANRPMREPCGEEVSDAECIERLTFNTSKIRSFWGDACMRRAQLLVEGSYLLLMGSFGALVGFAVFRATRSRGRSKE